MPKAILVTLELNNLASKASGNIIKNASSGVWVRSSGELNGGEHNTPVFVHPSLANAANIKIGQFAVDQKSGKTVLLPSDGDVDATAAMAFYFPKKIVSRSAGFAVLSQDEHQNQGWVLMNDGDWVMYRDFVGGEKIVRKMCRQGKQFIITDVEGFDPKLKPNFESPEALLSI